MYRPILTPKTVLPLFFSIGIIFAPIGGLLLYASAQVRLLQPSPARHWRPLTQFQVQELSIDYTNCVAEAPNSTTSFDSVPSKYVFSQFKNQSDLLIQWRQEPINVTFGSNTNTTQNCILQFQIPEDMGPPVLFYYQLTNFFQNHRRYVSSFDANQLVAKSGYDSVSSDCDPLTTDSSTNKNYYPCGLIANSVFNDTFTNLTSVGTSGGNYNMTEKGIAWSSDKSLYKKTTLDPSTIAPPPNWMVRYPDGYSTENPPPDISQDEHFMVWMRTAALPSFSKLYMRNDADTLRAGTYQLNITNCESRVSPAGIGKIQLT